MDTMTAATEVSAVGAEEEEVDMEVSAVGAEVVGMEDSAVEEALLEEAAIPVVVVMTTDTEAGIK